ncbi:MAG TPA: hypothetical protein VE620_10995 [Myxococcales bacterium]|jgi:hypothetical protein|nr:hypothetical protein [Myxococcales bacterium]
MRVVPLIAAVLFAQAARASSVRDEISVGGAQSTAQNPRAGNVSNLFGVAVDLGEDWTVSGTAQVTVEESTPAPAGSGFGDRGGTVTAFSLGADWDATDNWTLGVTFDASPASTITSDARFRVPVSPSNTDTSLVDALIAAASSNVSAEFLVTYDTAGFSDLEWSLTGAVAFSRFETTQRIEGARRTNGTTLSNSELRDLCTGAPSCSGYLTAINGLSDELRSAHFSLSGIATIQTDTDVGLGADYYAYFDDPANVGIFSLATVGRFGAGAPIAPLRFLVRPEVTHRIGPLSLRLWVQAGEYVANVGQGTASIGTKVQYRFTRAFRMWIGATGQRDVGSTGEVSRSGWVSLGAAYRF